METSNPTKQCPNCKCWFTQQKSFKHHIRHCRRTIAAEREYQRDDTPANPLLSIGSYKSIFEGGCLNLFGGGDKGGSKVGTEGSSSFFGFNYNDGDNDDIYSDPSDKYLLFKYIGPNRQYLPSILAKEDHGRDKAATNAE